MYITINDIKGEKMIDLSYPIQNFDSSKEVGVVRMLSDNIQYKVTKPLGLKLVDDSEKQTLNGSYTKRELDAIVGRKHILTDLSNDSQIIKRNKLAKVIDMIINLDELNIVIISKMEDPATPYLRIMFLVLKILRVSNQQHPNTGNLKVVRLFP